ncbi:MAG: HEAT repeat domain-containing protein [Planctomycetota bacterium]|nr:MAG: HEAT repeat domain-containing protein [Planctomycetota bacterium]
MLRIRTRRIASPVLLVATTLSLVVLVGGDVALAQQRQQAASEVSNEQLLADFLHYVLIRKDELAVANANALLQRGLSPIEFVGLVEDSRDGVQRFEDVVRRAMATPSLESAAAALWSLYEQGKRARSRDPEEIARNIAMLDGPARGRLLARERLKAAREYAAPQLLQVLQTKPNPLLETEVKRLLRDMGADAVAPLTAALLHVDPQTQIAIAQVLGGIASEAALPYLHELLQTASMEEVRGAARLAIRMIAGPRSQAMSLSDRYTALAERYYQEQRSLMRFPGEDHQLLWTFNPSYGLFPVPVRTEVFHEMRAMEIAQHAIELDPSNDQAVSLWIASNLRREIQTPAGWTNPAYPESKPGAMYYAVAGGSKALQPVLARAMRDKDTQLARKAIEALSRSAGGATLWEGVAADKPLVRALFYPDRRVRLEAALALARANPPAPFEGADRVAPILGAAAADLATMRALVVAADEEDRQDLLAVAQQLGYEVLTPAASIEEARSVVAQAPSVDLILMRAGSQTQQQIEQARLITALQVAPIVAQAPMTVVAELAPRYADDPLTRIAAEGLTTEQLATAVMQEVERASGPPITRDEARQYAQAALEALRTLAETRSEAFDVGQAADSLLTALEKQDGPAKLLVADVLARINQKRAQVALMDQAIAAADGPQRVALLERVALSVRRFGGMLDRDQLDWLVDAALVSKDESVATAAAALMGSLNMPELQVAPLILNG